MSGGEGDELEQLARTRVGTTLVGKYRLDGLLGIGGMAAVYRGVHVKNALRVAIKVLHPDLARSPALCERFAKEGYAANAVEHPGTVRVLDDTTTEDGTPFLVMELLEGESVDQRFEGAGRRLPAPEVCTIAQQLLDVLSAAHAKGIVHRDIKPENLFLTRSGELKVLDFGIARLRDGASATMTRTGQAMGTPAFMPQEQALGHVQEIDGRSDLFAVGATMFILLSGKFVHEASNVQELLVFAATRPSRTIRSVVSDVPAPLAEVIDRALAFDKKDRWSDAAAMRRALEEAYAASFGRAMPRAATRMQLLEEPAPDVTVRDPSAGRIPTEHAETITSGAADHAPALGKTELSKHGHVESGDGAVVRAGVAPTLDDTLMASVRGTQPQVMLKPSTTAGLSSELTTPAVAHRAAPAAGGVRNGLKMFGVGALAVVAGGGILVALRFGMVASSAAAIGDAAPAVETALVPASAPPPTKPSPPIAAALATAIVDASALPVVVTSTPVHPQSSPSAASSAAPRPATAPPPSAATNTAPHAPTRDCTRDRLDPISRKTRPECIGK